MDKEVIKLAIKELADKKDSYNAKDIFKKEIVKIVDEDVKKFKESGEMFKKTEKED